MNSDPPRNVHSTRCNATDGSFDDLSTWKAARTAGEWRVEVDVRVARSVIDRYLDTAEVRLLSGGSVANLP
jgi:hypothetical protein